MDAEIIKAKKILENRGLNNSDIFPLVDSNKLASVPNGQVVLNEKTYKMLKATSEYADTNGSECAFFLYGSAKGQTAYFMGYSSIWASSHCETNIKPILNELEKYAGSAIEKGIKGFIVAMGHTHPNDVLSGYQNYSLQDLATFMGLKDDNDVFRSQQIELVSCLLAGGEFNFMFYDNKANGFYKFDKVVVETKNGTYQLPCFGRSGVEYGGH